MKFLGSKQLETKRLLLKSQTMAEQKKLWEILMMPEVNKYYLTIPTKFKDKLKDWSIQEEYYKKEIENANNPDVFKWSIFIKETNECIGRISCHERHDEDETIIDKSIRGVGWYIHPKFQGKGYATEAAKAMLDYMFNEINITKIETGAAILNPASWHIMEKLGFRGEENTQFIKYTFQDKPVEAYKYTLLKEEYKNNYIKLLESKNIYYIRVNTNLIKDYLEMINDKNIQNQISTKYKLYSYDDEYTWLQKKLQEKALIFSMIHKDTNEFIGNIELMDKTNTTAELGICLTSKYQNQHLGTEAIKTILNYSFNTLNLKEVYLKVFSNNPRAIHCYENLGFKKYKVEKNMNNIQTIEDIYMKINKENK